MIKQTLMFIAVILANIAAAQELTNYKPNIVTPPPSVMEMEKYTVYNVDKKNGVSSFSIPIFNIKVGNINIPLSLDYHTSAVKYDFPLGELGVNWKLSDLGYISRSIRGRVDEHFDKPNAQELAKLTTENVEKERLLGSLLYNSGFSTYYDGEYDLFKYSTISDNGEFIIDDRSTKKVLSTKKTDKISYNYSPSSWYIYDLKIVGKNGLTYYYGKNPDNLNQQYIAKPKNGPEPITWYTTKIEGPVKEFVRFTYEPRTEISYIMPTTGQVTESRYSHSTLEDNLTKIMHATVFNNGIILKTEDQVPTWSNVIKEIVTSDNQRIVFTRETASPNLVKKIEIFSSDNKLVKFVELKYTPLGKNPPLLASVIIYGGLNDENPQAYKFSYYDEGKLIRQFDKWGFLQEQGMSDGEFPLFSFDTRYQKQRFATNSDGLEGWSTKALGEIPIAFKETPQLTKANDHYLMKEIQFPTGGRRTFEYESHKYKNSASIPSQIIQFGARVKRITSYDNLDSLPTLVIDYRYGKNDDGIGEIFDDLDKDQYFFFENPTLGIEKSINGSAMGIVTKNLTIYSVNPFHHLLDQIGNIYYPQVSEYNVLVSSQAGQRVYTDMSKSTTHYGLNVPFNKIEAFGNSGLSSPGGPYGSRAPSSPLNNNYYYNGVNLGSIVNELGVSYYKKDQNTLRLVKKIVNDYEHANIYRNEVLTQPYYVLLDPLPTTYANEYTTIKSAIGGNNIINYANSSLGLFSASLLKKQQTIAYFPYEGRDSSVATANYAYNDLDLLSEERIVSSNNTEIATTYSYAKDKGNQFLITKNMLDIPLQKKIIRKINTVNKTVSDVVTNFPLTQTEANQKTAGLPLPTSIFNYDLVTGLPVTEISYDKYDSQGNIVQYTEKENLTTSFIWGYSGQYPVAKIENAKYADIINVFGNEATAQNRLSKLIPPSVSDTTIRNIIQLIRSGIPQAQVSTYTYKPSVGMTSMSDPRGITAYYSFNNANRLGYIADYDQNIIKSFVYRYKAYSNMAISKTYTKNNCPSGQRGTNVIYSIPAGKYTSLISQDDADQKALNDLQQNGQNYANQNGSCENLMSMLVLANNTSYNSDISISISKPTAGGVPAFSNTYNFSGGFGYSYGSIPPGLYSVTVNVTDYSVDFNIQYGSSNIRVPAGETIYNVEFKADGQVTVSVNQLP